MRPLKALKGPEEPCESRKGPYEARKGFVRPLRAQGVGTMRWHTASARRWHKARAAGAGTGRWRGALRVGTGTWRWHKALSVGIW